MADKPSILRQWQDYKATKTQVFWSCAASVVVTIIVGFAWGGWVRGGTADEMATKAAAGARAELASAICVSRFASGPDATAQIAALKATDSWRRDAFLEERGWVALPGVEKPVMGAAGMCVQQLMDAPTPLKAAAVSG
jgi:hypothetical protein